MKTANLTPHISCSPEDFAKTVLMPGDPLKRGRPRAQGRMYRINKRTSHITIVVAEKA